jgi:electron transport complex protein RnfC
MSTATTERGTGTFARGVHPPDRKDLAAGGPIEVLPAPKQANIPVLQHIGAPGVPNVKPRTEVKVGDLIVEAKGFVSANSHASINGKTARASVATLPNGRHVDVVPIKADGDQPDPAELLAEFLFADCPLEGLDQHEPEKIVEAVRAAGLVGQGGAAFPTPVKLTRNPEKPVDTLLINGAECEPYLTADYRMMLESPRAILAGALLAAHAAGAKRCIVGIEDNKPDAIAKMREAASGTKAEIMALHTKYPQGGEKQLIPAALGREVPTGGLPLDVGVVVLNVGTAASLARAVLKDMPLTHRVMTVSGNGIKQPKNLLVPIGASISDAIDFCGGLTEDAERLIAGGPMMGFTLHNPDTPITKGTSGVTVLTRDDVSHIEETTCVRCGRCVDVCPLNLVPTKIAMAARNKCWEVADRYYMSACMECGCCAYVCPAHIPLVQLIRMGKAQQRLESRKQV